MLQFSNHESNHYKYSLDILKSQIESEIKSEVKTRSFAEMYGILSYIASSSEEEMENSQYTVDFNDQKGKNI